MADLIIGLFVLLVVLTVIDAAWHSDPVDDATMSTETWVMLHDTAQRTDQDRAQ